MPELVQDQGQSSTEGANGSLNGSLNGINGHSAGTDAQSNGTSGHVNGVNGHINGSSSIPDPRADAPVSGHASFQQPEGENVMPIAVIGMSCRFPGGCNNPTKLWDFLKNAGDGWSDGLKERFDMKAFYHPDTNIPGSFNATGGHFIKEDMSLFDAPFFNISPVEAKAMDPQQRLNMETAYEAIENAGLTMRDLVGSNTSVYYGTFNIDYGRLLARDPENFPFYQATGSGLSVLANRISYYFDLRGPSLVLDTGCSGSMIAIHLACESLRSGESEQAIVGGTNLMLDPQVMLAMSRVKFFSDQGRCYTFDSRGTGYGRGEGVAAVILKPLDKALRDGDPIRAIVRNTGTNCDGRTPGITMPSAEAQEALIRNTYRKAGLKLSDTTYFEAHGTGTAVGDPKETEAIGKSFGQGRSKEHPIYVGSIKTNIGHTESTSGIAGFIKTVLTLENEQIPPHRDFQTANPDTRLDEWNIHAPTKVIPWPENKPIRASINSFGYGGANAHAIVDGAKWYLDHYKIKQEIVPLSATNGSSSGYAVNGSVILNSSDAPNGNEVVKANGASDDHSVDKAAKNDRLFLFSAKAANAAKRQAMQLRGWLSEQIHQDDSIMLDNLAYTLGSRRSTFNTRFGVRASTTLELITKLYGTGIKPATVAESKDIGFVFTGQGAQWHSMGRELYSRFRVYRQAIQAAEKEFLSLGAEWSLTVELNKSKEDSRLGIPMLSQPVCSALQIALVDLLKSWGVLPATVVGHSSGEIAAAYAAGILTAKDALRVAYFRGFWVKELQSSDKYKPGLMLAVGAERDVVDKYIAKVTAGVVDVACLNSPKSYTISGDKAGIEELQELLDADEVWCRKLQVDVAYHSKHMEAVATEYGESLQGIEAHPSYEGCQFFSSVTGGKLKGSELDDTYWVKNLISPVQFSQGLEALVTACENIGTLVEIGPHSALGGPVKQTVTQVASDSGIKYFSVLKRGNDAIETAIDLAANLFTSGHEVDITAINGLERSKCKVIADLPAYPWNHSASYWHESRISSEYRLRSRARHQLLGVIDNDYNVIEPSWTHYIRAGELPWVRGHVIQGNIIFPAAAYICAVIQACIQHSDRVQPGRSIAGYNFRDLTIGRALVIPEDQEGVETKLVFRPETVSARASSETWIEFRFFSYRSSGGWAEHCRGLIEIQYTPTESFLKEEKLQNALKTCKNVVSILHLYYDLNEAGLQYSGPFQAITTAKAGKGNALSEITIPNTAEEMPGKYELPQVLHPATLDCCFQTLFPALMSNGALKDIMVPTAIGSLYVSAEISSNPGSKLTVLSGGELFGSNGFEAHLSVIESTENPKQLIKVTGLICSKLDSGPTSSKQRKISHNMRYVLDPDYLSKQQIEESVLEGVTFPPADGRHEHVESVVSTYIHQTLDALKDFDEETIPHEHHKHQLRWLRDDSKQWPNHGEVTDETRSKLMTYGPTGELIVRMGEALPSIIKGETESLSLLLEEDLLYRVYNDEAQDVCYDQMSKYLQKVAEKNPCINILEIGAGTGGGTKTVLESLGYGNEALFGSYDFTDISTGFFEKAQTKLEKWSGRIKYKRLDIEKSPEAQGFKPESYDIIIAVNVLHATSSISNTLKNVRSLLKAGGQMLLLEILTHSRYLNITFGCLPGWWLGVPEGRVNSPLLTLPEWHKALEEAGFGGVDADFHDHDHPELRRFGVIVSTARPTEQPKPMDKIELITPTDTKLDDPLVATITKSLKIEPSQVSNIESVEPEGKVCVVIDDLYGSSIDRLTEAKYLAMKTIFEKAAAVLWVTRGTQWDVSDPNSSAIIGWVRTFRAEYTESIVSTLDLDPKSTVEHDAEVISSVLNKAFVEGMNLERLELEIAERAGKFYVPRMISCSVLDSRLQVSQDISTSVETNYLDPKRPMRLHVGTPGLLDTLVWKDEEVPESLPADELVVEVKAAGVNFRDVMVSLGQLGGSTQMGAECSGLVHAVGEDLKDKFSVGDRVCGWSLGCYSNYPHMKGLGTMKLPEDVSFEEAASIPIVFSTAYYGLVMLANLKKNETVLIHSAMGGVGQAAVQLAKFIGAEIFVTVGSQEKRNAIKEKYGIEDDHIFSSRGLSFKEDVLNATGGKGVNVVLNSIAGEGLRASLECITYFGRFIEIGKRDILTNYKLEMASFDKNITFSSVDFTKICEFQPELLGHCMDEVFKLFANKAVKAVSPIITYPMNEIEDAFRLLQAGKHTGKVVMTSDNVKVRALPPLVKSIKFENNATYVIAGGLGGLGKAICEWMATLGARNIAILSRSGLKEEDDTLVESLKELGCSLTALKCYVNDREQVNEAFETIKKTLPPIKGVIQGAMVLKDVTIANMTYEEFQIPIGPKLVGTKYIHDATLDCELDHFVLLSSGSGVIGNQGQANYAASCTFQDAFARYRHSLGLKAHAMDLGMIQGVGYIANNLEVIKFLAHRGMSSVKLREFFIALDYACSANTATEHDLSQTVLGIEAAIADPGFTRFDYARRAAMVDSESGGGDADVDIAAALKDVKTWKEVVEIILEELMNKLAKMLAIPRADIQPTDSLTDLGADSLVAVELRNWLSKNLQANIQVLDILNPSNLKQFAEMIAVRSAIVPIEPGKGM